MTLVKLIDFRGGKNNLSKIAIASSVLAVSTFFIACDLKAQAAVVNLTFEGMKDGEQILTFYNGGTGSAGSVGPNYGISFSPNTFASISQTAGGGGNFSGEPSPVTIFGFGTSPSTINIPSGFDTGFSFYYTAYTDTGVVDVYDGLNGTGNLLATLTLPQTPNGSGDPSCNFKAGCPLLPFGVSFSGIAKSVNFSGIPFQSGFDNITLGAAIPCTGTVCTTETVPEPSSILGILSLGMLGIGAALKRKSWIAF